ncbi:MAG TPA: hypothetical protein P5175_12765, partial [Anaerohalosphaeraceae bacterium]|nr:hypothetical protein [Anaerohalosphaeraceae bacterium]
DRIKRILGIFEFSQNIENYWRGSNSAEKRKLLEIVSLNRHLSDVSLCVEKRKPFEILSKTAKSEKSRGDCQSFEPLVQDFIAASHEYLSQDTLFQELIEDPQSWLARNTRSSSNLET